MDQILEVKWWTKKKNQHLKDSLHKQIWICIATQVAQRKITTCMCASLCTNPSSHACSKCSQPKMSQQQGRMDAHSFECRAVFWCVSLRETVITFDGFAQIASVILREGIFMKTKILQKFHFFSSLYTVELPFLLATPGLKCHCCEIKPLCTQTQRDLCAHLLPQLFLFWDHLACSNNAHSATHKSLIFTDYTSVENYPHNIFIYFFQFWGEGGERVTHFCVGKCHTARCSLSEQSI